MDVQIQYSVCLHDRDLNIVLERNARRFVFGFFQNDKYTRNTRTLNSIVFKYKTLNFKH